MEENREQKISRREWFLIAGYAAVFFAVLLLSNLSSVNAWLNRLSVAFRPIVIGAVIAYLANPFFRFFERKLLVHLRPAGLRRALALLLTYLTLFLILFLLVILIFPQLVQSIQHFVSGFGDNLTSAINSANGLIAGLNEKLPLRENGEGFIRPINEENMASFFAEIGSSLSGMAGQALGLNSIPKVWNFLFTVFSGVANTLLAVFASLYLLSSKEKRYAQILRFRRAFFSDAANERITHAVTVADRSFGGFLRGKILDSAIVGVLTYLTCLIFRIPYALLVATIVGITDIIPVIGPFIGVIPTAIIILLTDPVKVIFFLVGILVIQQIDGNILAPKILGENTGVSSLCVMIAIIVVGGLYGLAGMIIGVPLFATILELLDGYINRRLSERGLDLQVELEAELPKPERSGLRRFLQKFRKPIASPGGAGDLSPAEQVGLETLTLIGNSKESVQAGEVLLESFAEQERELLVRLTPQESQTPEGSDELAEPSQEASFEGGEEA